MPLSNRRVPVDASLARFMNLALPTAHKPNRRVLEDVAWALDHFLRHRRRRLRSLRPAELRTFLSYWYLRHMQPPTGREARRFAAALRLLVRWLGHERTPARAARLTAETVRAARETARAARVSELLQETPMHGEATSDDADGYWEVMMLGEAHAILRDLHAAVPVGPVALPQHVVRALKPGAVLNLRLARGHGAWQVVAHGLCYPPVARAALRAASALPVSV